MITVLVIYYNSSIKIRSEFISVSSVIGFGGSCQGRSAEGSADDGRETAPLGENVGGAESQT